MHASIKKPVKIVDYCDFPLQNVNQYFIVSNITYYVMLLIDKFLHYSDYLLY